MIKENVKMTASHDQGQNKSICLESEAVLKIHTVQQHQVHLIIQEKESEMSPVTDLIDLYIVFNILRKIQQSLFTQVSQT